jgi:hypothetical protein
MQRRADYGKITFFFRSVHATPLSRAFWAATDSRASNNQDFLNCGKSGTTLRVGRLALLPTATRKMALFPL